MSARDDARALVAAVTPAAHLQQEHAYRVIYQHADGSVDVVPETSAADAGMGERRRVPVRLGFRGRVEFEISEGDEPLVLLAFGGGSEDAPYVAHVLQDGVAERGVARQDDDVSLGYWAIAPVGPPGGVYKLIPSTSADPNAVELTGSITSSSDEIKIR